MEPIDPLPIRVGDVVVCIEGATGSSIPSLATPLRVGDKYRVLGVRDADLGAPKGPVPHEIRLRTSEADDPRIALWYSSHRFQRVP